MVLPNDDIRTKLHHAGMVSGRKIIKVEATNKETQEKALVGEAEVEQPGSAYIFTGQGTREQGMGMSLYDSSPVAGRFVTGLIGNLWTIMVSHSHCCSPSPH